jgi:hypothetical protein
VEAGSAAIVAVAALDFVGAKVIFSLVLHAVPKDAEFVAVSTSLSRRVGRSAPEASSADEPLGAAVATPLPLKRRRLFCGGLLLGSWVR